MAINIQDQFNVNISLPIDSRIVASGSTARNAISYKYDGLRVFDTSDRKTYVWTTSTSTWTTPDISGSGDTGYVSRWSSTLGLTSSPLFVINGSSNKKGKVGINLNSSSDLKETFQINSDTTNSQPFVIHKGSQNNIIASNWYNNGSDQYFSVNDGSGGIKFRSNGEVWILNRSASGAAMVSSDGSFVNTTAVYYPSYIRFTKNLTFNDDGGSGSAAYIRATHSFSTQTTPDYTWWYNDLTGIYHPASDRIGFTIGGNQKMMLTSTGLLLSNSNNIVVPASNSRLHIDGGNGNLSIVKFTNGTTSGTGTNDGFNIGINTSAYPFISSRTNNNSFLVTFANGSSGGNNFHKIDRNLYTIYSNSSGESFTTVVANGGHRVIYGTFIAVSSSTSTFEIGRITVPNSCYVSVEATFTAVLATTPRQFRTHKFIASYGVNSSGVISSQNSGGESSSSGKSLAMLTSASATNINGGMIDFGTPNTIKFTQAFTTATSGHSVVSFSATINTGFGV